MRIVLRLVAALLAGLIVVAIALAVALPRYADTPEMRSRITQASREALGRPLSYRALGVGLLPPRIELSDPHVPGGDPTAPPLLDARRVDLRIALLPLLRLAIVIDSLTIEGLDVELKRTASGLDLPLPTGGAGDGKDEEAASEPAGGASLMALGIREVHVSDARLLLLDATLDPPVKLGFESLNLSAHGSGIDEPLEIAGTGDLATGGRLVVKGTTTLAGVLDVSLELTKVSLDGFAPYLGEGAALDAALGGRLEVRGAAAAPEAVEADLTLLASGLALSGTTVEGRVSLRAELGGEWSRLAGSFTLDATPAKISSGDAFAKPAKTPATLAGRRAPAPGGGMRGSRGRVELAEMQATGQVESGDTLRLSLDAAPFAAASVLALLPAAADAKVEGAVAIHGLEVSTDPLSIGGEVRLEGLIVELESGGSVDVSGRIVGRGEGVDLADVAVASGGQRIEISGAVRDLEGALPFTLRLDTPKALRADALLTGLDPSLADTVYGPLTLRGRLTGRAGVPDPGASLVGDLHLDMGEAVGDGSEGGRIVGFSLLGSIFEGLDKLGHLSRVTGLLLGGRAPDLSAYTGDSFERLQVAFRLEDGLGHTDQARIVYRSHAADLHGTVRLSDLALDMEGAVQLAAEVALALGAKASDGEITVPVAHIGGTLDSPEIDVSKKAVASLASQLVSSNIAVKGVLEGADKVVPGAGHLLDEGLGVLFGGGRRDDSGTAPGAPVNDGGSRAGE